MFAPDQIAGYIIPQIDRRPEETARLHNLDLEGLTRRALKRERVEAACALEFAKGLLAVVALPAEPAPYVEGATNAVPQPSGPRTMPAAVWLTRRIEAIDRLIG